MRAINSVAKDQKSKGQFKALVSLRNNLCNAKKELNYTGDTKIQAWKQIKIN